MSHFYLAREDSGGKVGMNDIWDAMCHEERKKRCSTAR